MANENITTFNRPPYYDDFNEPDLNQNGLTTWKKDYQRLLFQPAYAVQTRELNQLQSILQNQVSQLGVGLINPNFGAKVSGGASNKENAIYIDVKFDNPFTQAVENNFDKIKFFESRQKTGANVETKIRSRVLSIKKKPGGDSDEYRIWFKYVNQQPNSPNTFDYAVDDILYITNYRDNNWRNDEIPDDTNSLINIPESPDLTDVPDEYKDVYGFNTNDGLYGICRILQITDKNGGGVTEEDGSTPKAVGDGFVLSVDQGVFFIKGTLVHTYPQTYYYVRTDANEEFDGYMSFIISESIVTSQDDSTLLDNANGTYNYAAPGADRYKLSITLALNTFDPDIIALNEGINPIFNASDSAYSSINYINIREIKDGNLLLAENEISLSEQIDNYIKTRTYEESGNYTLRPFICRTRELLNLNGRGGRYTLKQIFQNEFELLNNYFIEKKIDLRLWTKDDVNNNGTATLEQNQGNLDAFITWLDDRLIVDVDPSICYVDGKRIELLETQTSVIKKARDFIETTEVSIAMPRGNFVEVVLNPDLAGSNVANIDTIFTETSKVKNIIYQGTVTQAEIDKKLYPGEMSDGIRPETIYTGISHLNYLKFKLHVYNDFDVNEPDHLPTGFEFRYFPDSITGFSGQSLIRDNSLKNPRQNKSVYNIGGIRAIKNVKNIEYSKQVLISGAAAVYNKQVSFSTNAPSVFSSGINKQSLIIYNSDTGKYIDPFIDIFDITGQGTTALTITFNDNTYNGHIIKIITPITVNNFAAENGSEQFGSRKTKNKIRIHSYDNNPQVPDIITVSCNTGLATLSKQDVILSSLKITEAAGNLCSFRVIDNGLGDNFYDNPIIKVDGYTSGTLGETVQLKAYYDYYDHTPGDYFVADSYESSTPYDEIPVYGNSRLSDFIDFRVKRKREYDAATDTYTYTLAESQIPVIPNTGGEFGIVHYMSRIDVVSIKSNGDLVITEGESSLDPYPPQAAYGKPSLMPIYEIRLNPYTYDPDDVIQRYIENSRYTMKDISRIEKRVNNLEYYSSLSLLEKEAEGKKILDLSQEGAGAERFKNGILVDSFVGHGTGNSSDPDYLCSVDVHSQTMSPAFHVRNFRMRYTGVLQIANGGFDRIITINKNDVPTQEKHRKLGNVLKESGSTFDGKTHFGITKPIGSENTEGYDPGYVGNEIVSLWQGEREILYENLLSSQTTSVQPFEVTTWLGRVTLSPSSDEWIDTEWLDPHIVDLSPLTDSIGEVGNLAINAYGTNTTFIGSTLIDTDVSTKSYFEESGHGGFDVTETTVTKTYEDKYLLQWYTQGFNENVTIDFGDRVVDTSIVPFIRSRDIQFKGYGFQPNTQVYVFFDGQNVTDYCYLTQETEFVPFGHNTNIATYNGQTFDDWGNEDFLGVTNNEGNILATDEFGRIFGVFRIPNNWQRNQPSTNNTMSFPIGIREFKIIDNEFNNELESFTYGSTTYNADGLRQDKQASTASPRIPTLELNERIDTRTRKVQSTSVEKGPYHDPVAQTFFIGEEYPNGVYLSDVDIFFATKTADPNIPISVYIVPVENGIPTNTILPGSEKTLLSSDIPADQITGTFIIPGTEDDIDFGAIVEDPIINHPTRFTFDFPVYLKPKKEYAIVVFSTSPDYRIWTSLLDKADLNTNQVPNRNPGFGVFLKSQNKRTWTPDQYRDMTIRLHKAVFPVGETHEFKFSTLIPNSGTGYHVGDQPVVVGNNQGVNYLSEPDLIRLDHTFIQPLFKILELPGTDVNLEITYYDSGGDALNESFGVVNNLQEIFLRQQIPSRTDTNSLVNHIEIDVRMVTFDKNISPIVDCETGSIYVRQNEVNNLTTGEGSEYVVSNNDLNVYEWSPSSRDPYGLYYNGGDAVARYITKNVVLNNSSEDLRVNLAVHRPTLNCDIHVYAKRKIPSTYEKSMFEEIPWYKMEILSIGGNTNNNVIPVNNGSNDFTEIEYILPSPDPNKTVYDDSLIDSSIYTLKGPWDNTEEYQYKDIIDYNGVLYVLSDNYYVNNIYQYSLLNDNEDLLPDGVYSPWSLYTSPGFNEFSVKVVFTSTDKAQVCKIKNLTAIASV